MDNNQNVEPSDEILETEKLKKPLKVLAIKTLTNIDKIHWEKVKSNSFDINYEIEELEDFNKYFETGYIENSLIYAEPIIKKKIEEYKPDVLLTHSKGIGLITYLIYKNLWSGPVLLLSPIPNKSEHLENFYLDSKNLDNNEDEWEHEWVPTIKLLEKLNPKNVGFGIGSSLDEKDLIFDYISSAALKNNWKVKIIEGDHSWIVEEKNAEAIGQLIDELFS